MELSVETGQPVPTPLMASASPVPTAAVDPTVEKAGPRSGSESPTESYWAECECPDDCLRDHEND